jgi:rhodanese-related sulfurtransferase
MHNTIAGWPLIVYPIYRQKIICVARRTGCAMTVAAVVAIPAPTIDAVVDAHAALRAKRPLVQVLTNTVSSNFVANVLLSAGASPAMVDNPEEAACSPASPTAC